MSDSDTNSARQLGSTSALLVIPSAAEQKYEITDLLDEGALSALLGVSRSTLQMWRYASRGPRYLKIGRLVRYRRVDVEAFLKGSERATVAEMVTQ